MTEKQVYRFLESFPGILTWALIVLTAVLVIVNPILFLVVVFLFTIYWVSNCVSIVFHAWKGYHKIEEVQKTNWKEKLETDFPDWKSYYYCTIIPFASESINVIRPTVESLVVSDFPKERRILCLSSEKALPQGKLTSEQIAKEYADQFAHIFITEHELKPGELKGKSSNQNHCGRFLYQKAEELGIDPGHILLSSNDSDMLNDRQYQTYLLYSYLSRGENRDCYIYQPVPTDYNNFWEADFFSRMIITTGVLFRLYLHERANYRCTVYAFYSMSLKTLHDIGFWDTDLIPEDERTMFNAISAFGDKFKVYPLYIMSKGSPIRGKHLIHSFKQQYVQIRRWAWGASEFAHSVTMFLKKDKKDRKALILPILNQLRTSTEWSLASLFLMFAGLLPGLFHPDFPLTPLGQIYPGFLAAIMSIGTMLLVAIVILDLKLAPERPQDFSGWKRFFSYAQWLFAPVVGLAFSSLPALEAQTRLIFNKRIAYIETQKENI